MVGGLRFIRRLFAAPALVAGLYDLRERAMLGDTIARLYEAAGFDVTREYYFNDGGRQMKLLGESVRALALGEPVPEDGYRGDYVATLVPPERARELDIETLSREACDACLELIRRSLERFGVRFDVWFSERSLHTTHAVERVLEELARRGATYVEDGALWLRTTARGDDRRTAAGAEILRRLGDWNARRGDLHGRSV